MSLPNMTFVPPSASNPFTATLHLPTLPSSLSTGKAEASFSFDEVFLPRFPARDLQIAQNGYTTTVNAPRFSGPRRVQVKLYAWKGERILESWIVCTYEQN